ncbi:MAG: hypothetical protein ABI921_08320 [Panacibacter sp.]
MKKRLLWLPILLLVTGAAIYRPVKETLSKQAPVSQSISFAVYKGNNYTSEVYNNTSAQIHITVEKVSGNNRSKVWDKTFDAKQLKQYPSIENALSQKVTVPNVLNKKEHLEVTYTLTYNSKGSELRMQNGTVVSGDLKSGKVDISI